MACGCISRRHFLLDLLQRFSAFVWSVLTFSIANNAFGKSTEGAFIESAEGARGFGTTGFVHTETLDEEDGLLLYEHGDLTTEYAAVAKHIRQMGVLGETQNVYDTLVSAVFSSDTTFPAFNSCLSVPTSGGYTKTTWTGGSSPNPAPAEERLRVEIATAPFEIVRDHKKLLLCDVVDEQIAHFEKIPPDPP